MLAFLDHGYQARETVVIATVIAADDESGVQVGERLLVDAGGIRGGTLRSRPVAAEVHSHARGALASEGSHLAHVPGCTVFVERVAPPLDLVVFGAGDDVMPLVSMAGILGWRVTVADPRPAYAKAERFPGAARVLVLPRERLLRDIDVTPATAVVVMTHNYPLDARLVPLLVERDPLYLGLLGPRHRAERLFEERALPVPSGVYAPAGLDVGGDGPVDIALSIVAEVQAVYRRRSGSMLRTREQAIHSPVLETGAAPEARRGTTERLEYCETLAGSHAA
jgi:xanthine/CO dehydrogenase XdhC/CoxF family maturation factor